MAEVAETGTEETLFEFTLVTNQTGRDGESMADALFEGGCDDAVVVSVNGTLCIEFERPGDDPEQVISEAIVQIKKALPGVDVVRVEPDPLVTLADAAERMGVSRQHLHNKFSRKRGDGTFPLPVSRVTSKNPLFHWVDILDWATRAGLADVSVAMRQTAAAIYKTNRGIEVFLDIEKYGDDIGMALDEIPENLEGSRDPLLHKNLKINNINTSDLSCPIDRLLEESILYASFQNAVPVKWKLTEAAEEPIRHSTLSAVKNSFGRLLSARLYCNPGALQAHVDYTSTSRDNTGVPEHVMVFTRMNTKARFAS